jgi:hypothetical protein
MQVCVNGEPILTVEPRVEGRGTSSSQPGGVVQYLEDDAYWVRRSSHSAGEMTSVGLDQYVALPPRAVISVRLEAPHRAQGFMFLNKL